MTDFSAAPITFQFEIVAEDENPASPAELDIVAVELTKALREAGYEVRPAYTGSRGGDLFDIIISNADKTVDLADKVIGFVAITVTVVKKLREKSIRQGQERQPPTLKITTAGHLQAKATIQDTQQQELEQLREQVKHLQEQIKQNQLKATLAVQPAKRKKQP